MRFQFGELQLDDERFTLSGPSGPIHVEPQVFELLHHLIVHNDRVVTKQELFDSIWGHTFVSESALTSRLKSARRAVGDDGTAQRVIRTVHGRGYQFVADVRIDAGSIRREVPHLRHVPIGRDDDIASIVGRLRDAPVVTVTGPGGIGKTTVALAVADQVRADYAEGIVFVDLAAAPAQSDVTRIVADAAGVEGAAAASIDSLGAHLANRPILLVLDNCEHVLASSSVLVDRMLAQGTTADVLTTSREPLGVGGEHLWPLGSLHHDGPILFVERARAAEPRVEWDPADPDVVELCRRLDDVPLALELAAGQLRRFDLRELLDRLDGSPDIGGGVHTGGDAERHASMASAIDWSYRLLEPSEQCLLRQLGVFPSTFDVRAMEASAPPLLDTPAIEVFGHLVDKSLVVRDPGTGRYRLLETIRTFAAARLEEAGETADARERHRCQVRDRVAATSRLDRWMSAPLAAALRLDLDDARQAFRLSLDTGAVDDALEIAVGASFLWRQAIGCAEGASWTDALLERELSGRDQMWLHILRSDLGQGRGDHRQMFGAATDALAVPAVDDPAAASLAAHYAALADLTDPGRARDSIAAARDLAVHYGDARLVTLMDVYFAVADLAAGRHEDAAAGVNALDHVASEDGYDRYMLHWAGWMTGLAEHDGATARRWMSRQQDYLDRTGIVETWLTSYSTAMCDVIDGGDVVRTLSRALALADREGYRAEADCLLVLAYAEQFAGRFDAAAELIGTAMHERFNATAHYVLYRAVLERPLRRELDGGELADAIGRGRSRRAADALAEYGVTGVPA